MALWQRWPGRQLLIKQQQTTLTVLPCLTAARTHGVGNHHKDDNLQDPAQGQALGGKAQEHGDGGGTCRQQ